MNEQEMNVRRACARANDFVRGLAIKPVDRRYLDILPQPVLSQQDAVNVIKGFGRALGLSYEEIAVKLADYVAGKR